MMTGNSRTLILSFLLIFILAFGMAGCTSKKEPSPVPQTTQIEKTTPADNTNKDTAGSTVSSEESNPASKTFTLEELAQYDGKNGKPAYAAVDGIVYDISNDRAWREGEHEAYRAGTDLTKDMANAPHGRRVLNGLPVVGKLVK